MSEKVLAIERGVERAHARRGAGRARAQGQSPGRGKCRSTARLRKTGREAQRRLARASADIDEELRVGQAATHWPAETVLSGVCALHRSLAEEEDAWS